VLLNANREVGREVNAEGAPYIFMSQQNAVKNHNIKIANKSVENVAKFRYFAVTLTAQNCMHEEIRSILNSGDACYSSVQDLFSSHLLSKTPKTKIYRIVTFPLLCMAV
jgi:hypothetical protein